MIEIADEMAHRALGYVAEASRYGYVMTEEEFTAYVVGHKRRVPRLKMPLVSALPAMLETVGEAETVLQWLARLKWLGVDDGFVSVTPLGRAVLRSLDTVGSDDEIPADIILDRSDKLAYARLLGRIAESGPGTLVDHYFHIDQLEDVLTRTAIDQVLVGPDPKREASLFAGLRSLTPPRPFEIRVSPAFHDRFIVPKSGRVILVGTSLNGVGKRLSVSVNLDESLASGIKQALQVAWQSARKLQDASDSIALASDPQVAGRSSRKPAH